jgi:hypothetical protein
VAFLEAESFGLWHGRARAMMSRRLKHRRLTDWQSYRVVQAVLGRLATGRFSEQFEDQLQLALRLDPEAARAVALTCLSSPRNYIRRYAEMVLRRPWIATNAESRGWRQ